MTRCHEVLNKYDKNTAAALRSGRAVYVGRPSKWGNPFSHLSRSLASGHVKTREEAIARHKALLDAHIAADPRVLDELRAELRGYDLVCFCAPLSCHADILLKYANGADPHD